MEQHILSAENLQLGYDGRVIVDSMEAVISCLGCSLQFCYNTFAAILTHNRFPPVYKRWPQGVSFLGTAGSKQHL